MITIGENLKLARFEVKECNSSEIKLISLSDGVKTVARNEIVRIELIGTKNNSGYSGTMEWGMKNPTFMLPTNFWYNIISWFKRRDDIVYYKITVAAEEQFVVFSGKKLYKEISSKVRS